MYVKRKLQCLLGFVDLHFAVFGCLYARNLYPVHVARKVLWRSKIVCVYGKRSPGCQGIYI